MPQPQNDRRFQASSTQFGEALTLNWDEDEMLCLLEHRLRMILPAMYQDSYEEVQPVSMGSAGLKYDWDGKVAWDQIWGSFCDLAMAGGPPHKGTLLEPASPAEIEAAQERYLAVVEEICRGVRMVTEFSAERSEHPGWVRVDCGSRVAAEWLVRAIVMENVSAGWEGTTIDLPAGPGYRIEKEIKNVITSIAKTSHYWLDHMWSSQKREIGALFLAMAKEHPLIQSASVRHALMTDDWLALRGKVAESIFKATGLGVSAHTYANWLGISCPGVSAAIWMMRALVVNNVLSRREGTTLFLPINPELDPGGEIVVNALLQVHRLAISRDARQDAGRS